MDWKERLLSTELSGIHRLLMPIAMIVAANLRPYTSCSSRSIYQNVTRHPPLLRSTKDDNINGSFAAKEMKGRRLDPPIDVCS
jgi:hypothetical protein